MEFELKLEPKPGYKITILEDSLNPPDWQQDKRDIWLEGESNAYSIYTDTDLRIEREKFFDDYLLFNREPVIAIHSKLETIKNRYYFSSGNLVAFSTLFSCDFRDYKGNWHGANIAGTIGIIPRKTFSKRSKYLIDPHFKIPFVRLDNLKYINSVVALYPKGTRFSFCAHLQPESNLLIRNLIKLNEIRKTFRYPSTIPAIHSLLQFLPSNFWESFNLEEIQDKDNTSYFVLSFSS